MPPAASSASKSSVTPRPTVRALVTGGSTVGRLDAVRVTECIAYTGDPAPRLLLDSQNPFRGTLGLRIAEGLRSAGVDATLLTRLDLLAAEKHSMPDDAVQGFFTFEDLERQLPELLRRLQPDIVVMSAAVSDYVPVAIEGADDTARKGKIRSDNAELVVRFRATPKLLDGIRPIVGPESTIVGFKLLVGASEETLRSEALKQMTRAHTDGCVVNDFSRFGPESHPCALITQDGAALQLDGSKAVVGEALARHVLALHETRSRAGESGR